MTETALDELRQAFITLLGAERRLRGREGHDREALSLSHFRLLSCLLEAGPLPTGRLAAAAQLTPASGTQMLDLLERRGMVVREREHDDRRVVVASLTDEGRRLTTARRDAFRELWREALGDLAPEQLTAGTEVLARIATLLEQLATRTADDPVLTRG